LSILSIATIILAAGESSRFGKLKQLLEWNGVSLVAHGADVALDAGLGPVIVVLGCEAEAARRALGARPVQAVTNWRWKEGLSTSVQTGLAAVPPESEAAILMQCDQPLVTPGLLQALARRFADTQAAIVHPTHAGQRGTPTLFDRRLFAELASVSGDTGGRAVIAKHPDEIATLEVTDRDVLADIDTPADYERLVHKVSAQGRANTSPETILPGIRHLIIDMDGVLWRGNEPTEHLQSFFALLHERSIDYILATNNSSRTPEQYTAKLASFGVQVPTEAVLTSSQVAAAYLANQASGTARAFAIGGDGLRRALEAQGFELVTQDAERADYVVVGWDTQLTWDKLATAAFLIHRGAGFVGTNPDVSYPTERGPAPGNGAQLAALETTTGVTPIVTGKPEPPMYEEAMRRMRARPETTAVIGDRLDTDIAGGVRLGLATILVLSGIATESDLEDSPIRPDVVCADIGALIDLMRSSPNSSGDP
jgi:4-nitrophenyl phosphatase